MLGRLWKVLFGLWTCFAAAATCIDAWANKESVSEMNVTLSAYAVWLFPHILLGLGIFLFGLGSTIGCMSVGSWYLDRRREGPQIRKFESLTCRIEKLKTNLAEYYDQIRPLGWRVGQFNVLNAEISMIRTELRDLGIQIPIFEDSENQEHVHYLLSYLGGVEQLARRGNLRDARKIWLEPEWVYRGPEDGKIHDS